MSAIVIGTTVPPFKSTSDEAVKWLETAEIFARKAKERFDGVYFFAALEVDGRDLEPHKDIIDRLDEIQASGAASTEWWKFLLDCRDESIDGLNRLHRICTGRNLICEYAMRDADVSHVMFLDSDLKVPEDAVPRLMEVFDYKPSVFVAGGDVPSYCLAGPIDIEAPFPVQMHWNTAGFLLVRREVLNRIRWRSSHYPGGHGLSDDPCFAQDVRDFGFGETHVRKDVIALHTPLVPLERRGHDLKVYR